MPSHGDPPAPESAAGRWLRFLGLQRSTVGVLAMVVLVGMGERMSERFLPIYLIALGGGALSIGLLNALDHLLSALYSYIGGYLSDRLGTRRALVLFNLVAMAGFLIVILFPFWQAVIVGAVLFISWSSVSLPATMGLIVRVLPAGKRIMGASMYSLVNRIPMALGPILGGLCIAAWGERDGVRVAFGAALALALVGLALQQAMIVETAVRTHDRAAHFLPACALAAHAPGAAQPAGRRHPGAVLRADHRRLRRGLVHEGDRAAGERGRVRGADLDRDGHGRVDLHPRGLAGRSRRQEALRAHHLRHVHRLSRWR